jgi:hypothetical protein
METAMTYLPIRTMMCSVATLFVSLAMLSATLSAAI